MLYKLSPFKLIKNDNALRTFKESTAMQQDKSIPLTKREQFHFMYEKSDGSTQHFVPGSILPTPLPASFASIREPAGQIFIQQNQLPAGYTVLASDIDPPVIAPSNGINNSGGTAGLYIGSQNELQQPPSARTSDITLLAMVPIPGASPFLMEAPAGIQNHGMTTLPYVMKNTCQYRPSLVQGRPQQQQQEHQEYLRRLHLQQKDQLLQLQQQEQHRLEIQQQQEREKMKQQIFLPNHSKPWQSVSSETSDLVSCNTTAIIVDGQASDNIRRTIEGKSDENMTRSQRNDADSVAKAASQLSGGLFMAGTKRPPSSCTPYASMDTNEMSSKRSCIMGIKEYSLHVSAPSPPTDAASTANVHRCNQQKQYENGINNPGTKNYSFNASPSISSRRPLVSPQEKEIRSDEESDVNEVLQTLLKDHEKNKPRRPLTAYNFYFSEERERVLAKIPEPSNEEQKQIGELSNSSNTSNKTVQETKDLTSPAPLVDKKTRERTKFEEDLRKIKERIAKAPKLSEKEQYALDEMVRMKTKSTLDAHTEAGRRKRSHKREHGKVSFRILCALIGERWKFLSETEKAHYVGLAKQDLDRYRKGMVVYGRQKKEIRDKFFSK